MLKLTYEELLDHFTEEELEDAAVIAQHEWRNNPSKTHGEVYLQVLREMWSCF